MNDRAATDAPLWRPTPERVARTQLTEFTRIAGERTGRDFGSYADLHRWSIEFPGDFWQLVWEFTGVVATVTAAKPVADLDRFPGRPLVSAVHDSISLKTCSGATTIASADFDSEPASGQTLTYAQLRTRSPRWLLLRAAGLVPGDRVAGWLPNTAEAVIAMLATASLGGVWSSCSPDFGTDGALDRFGQIEPKLLIACDGYVYGGKRFAIGDKVEAGRTNRSPPCSRSSG